MTRGFELEAFVGITRLGSIIEPRLGIEYDVNTEYQKDTNSKGSQPCSIKLFLLRLH